MRDQGFYVQMHLHTAESSRCARVGGADMARACKEAGYDLIVVTDHFFNANTCVPYDLPWEEQVRGLFAGYRAAKLTKGVTVFGPSCAALCTRLRYPAVQRWR